MNTRVIYALATSALALFVIVGYGCSDDVEEGGGGGDGGINYMDRPEPGGDIIKDVGPNGDGGDVEADGGTGDSCGAPDNFCKKSQECRCGVCKPHWCTQDDDCNPGQICTAKVCRDSFTQCSSGACDLEGQKCITADGKSSCHFDSCGAGGVCPEGTQCFNTFCVVELPCNGKCLASQVCLTDRNECIPKPEGCDAACEEGQLLVFKDPGKSTYQTCEKVECACEYLPNIAVGEYGHYASVAVKGGEAYAAAYSRTYGDLIVTKFESGSGDHAAADPATAVFVDGVPTSGKIAGNPKGPRNGITDPGPDVGKYTSIGVGGDTNLAVAYYDATNGDLKFAHHDGEKWAAHVVDGADGSDVGMYAAMAFSSDGKPHVAYYQKNGAPGAGFLTAALKLAVGKVQAPASSSDWTITVVDSSPISCRGLCKTGEVCAEQAPLAACVPELTTCSPACDKQKCIDVAGTPTCIDEVVSPAPELTEGTGLFPSIVAAADGNDYIAYYDHAPIDLDTFKGNLKTAVVVGGAPTIAIQDGEDAAGVDTGDVGRFASIAQSGNGEFGIAYFDATMKQLKYWHGTIGQPAAIEVVVSGISPGLKEFTGPDCSLGFDGNNVPRIAFQNATLHTLLYAVRDPGADPWPAAAIGVLLDPADASLTTKYGTGGYGFFAKQKIDGTTSYIVNLKVGFTDPDLPTPDNKLILYKKKF